MKIIALSDTHNQHWKMTIPDGDILIHAGDFSFHGDQREILDFNEWLGTLPHTYKVVVPGNHELGIEGHVGIARALLGNADHLLVDEGITLEGVKIWGSPYTPEFCNWAFQYTAREGELRWDQIPEGLDILVTHGPPRMILDSNGQEAVGCPSLLKIIQQRRPRHHVFGHIHESYGDCTINDVHYHNVSQLDEQYRISGRTPAIIEI
jgi:Icc-related predicted phosphoesterase